MDLRRLPKVDLHCHLDGTVRVSTLMDLARRHGVPLPAEGEDALARRVKVGPGCQSLAEFLECFRVFLPAIRVPGAARRIAREMCEDQAGHNVRYVETRFAPRLITPPGGDPNDIVAEVVAGLAEGERAFGIVARAIIVTYRGWDAAEIERTARIAERFAGRGVVGVDIAGDEAAYPAAPHRAFFDRARAAGLGVTVHAGEAGPASNIREAIDDFGARRIGHGVRLGDDEALLDRVARDGVALEMCLTSNVQTRAVAGYAGHPALQYLRRGLKVTLNTDDYAVSATDLTREFRHAVEDVGFTLDEIRAVVLNAVGAAFLPDGERRALAQRIVEDLAWTG